MFAFPVTFETQPSNIKRPIVIVVVRLRVQVATSLARLPNQLASSQRTVDQVVGSQLVWKSGSSASLARQDFGLAFWPLESFALVGRAFLSVISIALLHVGFGAFLAFVQAPVLHSRMAIEVGQRLCLAAFETSLHDDLRD